MKSTPFTAGEFFRLLPKLLAAYFVGWLLILSDFFARIWRRSSR
jgi:hypothetical protein